MSQVDSLEIGSRPSGLTYRGQDNARVAAVATHHEGADWPVDPDRGWIALKTGVNPWQLGIWDDGAWIIIGTVNPTTNVFTPSGQSNWVAAAIDITSTDLNNLPSSGSGIYRGSSLANRPGDTDVVYVVQQFTVDANNLIQHSWRLSGGGLWTRRRVSGTWSGWTRLDEIADGAVTNAKLATVATQRFKGRTTAGNGAVEDLTPAQAAAMLPAFTPDTGSGGVKGMVPTPGAGDAATGKVLGASGWQAPGFKLLHLQGQKSSGTNGGDFFSGAWFTRELTHEIADDIGSTLSSNTWTLPVGTYEIEASAPGFRCEGHVLRLYNVSDAAAVLAGRTEYSATANQNQGHVHASLRGRFAVAGSTKTYRLEHRCTGVTFGNGLGVAAGLGPEIYAEVLIRKVG